MSTTPPTIDDDDDSELREALGMGERVPPATPAPGLVIDDAYRIERKLGAGGMGAVYLARDLRLHRDVAIKVHTMVAGEPGERLLREATAMAQLVHPNVVTVHEVGTWAGHPYVAMEHVAGGTVRQWLAATPRTAREILALFVKAGRGLAAAHAAGMIHRDFKPDNVLVGDDGRVRVADFGLARGFGDADGAEPSGDEALSDLTATGAVMGTPAYMAPEQRRPGRIGPAADQFAFAVALWEALCGQRPGDLPSARSKAPRISARSKAPRIAPHVERALRRALAADPQARFPSMDLLLDELARDPAARRRRAAWIGAVALGIAALGASAVVLLRDDPDARAAQACARAGDVITETWSPARRATIARGFAATGRGHAATTAARVGDALDAYASAWSVERVEACHAHRRGEQSAQLLDLRQHCLATRRAELSALVSLFEHAPDAALVDRALDATQALGDLDACRDVPRLDGVLPRPDSPVLDDIEARIAQARVAFHAGRFEDGLATAESATTDALALGYAPTTAEARLWLAHLQQASGDPRAARATLDAATKDAAAAHDDDLAAQIWLAVLYVVTSKLDELAEGERLLPYVEAAVVRAGTTPALEGMLARIRGTLFDKQGKWKEAEASLARARTLIEEHYGPTDYRLALVLNLQAGVWRDQGELAQAIDALAQALAILEVTYGGDHPQVAATRNNYATLLLSAEDFERARVELERVIASKERLLGPDHPELVSSLANLSSALLGLHRATEARPYLARALAIVEARYGKDHPAVGRILSLRGDVEVATGELAAARATYDRALTLLEPALGSDQPDVAELYLARGEVRRQLGDLAGARADLTRALATFEALRGKDHPDVTRVREALAKLADPKP